MNSRAIYMVIFALIGIPVAFAIGIWTATDLKMTIGVTLILLAIITALVMGRHLWLLLPLAFPFTGSIALLPGNFAPRDIIALFVFSVLVLYWCIRRFPLRLSIGLIEIALLIQLAMIGQAYLRNPAGIALFGSDVVGARPYFEMGISILIFITISVQVVEVRRIKNALVTSLTGGLSLGLLETLGGLIPQFAYRLAPFYQTNAVTAAVRNINAGTYGSAVSATRMIYLKWFVEPLTSILLATRSPLAILDPRKPMGIVLIVFIACFALLSGFRSAIVWIGLMVIAAAIIRKKGQELVILSFMTFPVLVAVLLLQGNLIQLPIAAQRALSFLPAKWDYNAVNDAKGSLEWRVEMWQQVLTTDRYIRNKVLGDGFGFSAHELKHQYLMEAKKGRATPEEMQEYYMITGGYHSGPVETIRRVGYIGLFLLLVSMGLSFVFARRCIRRSLGTPYQTASLFFGLPLLILPFMFVFIYGAFAVAIGQICFHGGVLKLINTSREKWATRQVKQQQQAEQEETQTT